MRLKIVLYWIILIIVLFTCIGCSKDEDTDLVVYKTSIFSSNIDGSLAEKLEDISDLKWLFPLSENKLIFISYNSLYLYHLERDNPEPLKISDELSVFPSDKPVVNSDKTKIYFCAAAIQSDDNAIYLYDINQNNLSVVFYIENSYFHNLSISPDDNKILCTKSSSENSIIEIDLQSNSINSLIISNFETGPFGDPCYLNNDEFYFIRRVENLFNIELFDISSNSSTIIMSSSYLAHLDISPDKNSIIFESQDGLHIITDQQSQLDLGNGYYPMISNNYVLYTSVNSTYPESNSINIYNIIEGSIYNFINNGSISTLDSEESKVYYFGAYKSKDNESRFILN